MSKYQKSWETKSILKDWIQAVPDDSTKAYCRFCKIKLYAHRYSILKHASTKKHQDNYIKQLQSVDTIHRSPAKQEIEGYHPSTNKEETLIEGDALIYHETVDIFCPPSDDSQPPSSSSTVGDQCYIEADFDSTTPIVNHYETVAQDISYKVEEDEGNEYLTQIITAKNELPTDDISNCMEVIEEENMQQLQATTSDEIRTISSHVLDTSAGKAAVNIPITIYRLENSTWHQLNQTVTNEDGRVGQLLPLEDFQTGIYKLHFNVQPYFAANQVKSLYPFIEIAVECVQGQHYHIPLLLNPYGYSTYRGT